MGFAISGNVCVCFIIYSVVVTMLIFILGSSCFSRINVGIDILIRLVQVRCVFFFDGFARSLGFCLVVVGFVW